METPNWTFDDVATDHRSQDKIRTFLIGFLFAFSPFVVVFCLIQSVSIFNFDATMFFSRRLCKIAEQDLGRHLKLPFIDKLRVYVRAGRGGNGLKKYGGIGGQGGHVIVRGQRHLTLKQVYEKNLLKRYVAADGEQSQKRCLNARPAENLILHVPLGIQIRRDNDELVDEINDLDDQCIVAYGGDGGNHKNSFEGQPGETTMINFDLKLLADVG